jgi:putative oxidoreductase
MTDLALLLLRLWAGGVMAVAHGWPKLGRLSDDPIQFADPLGIGPTLSLVCTILTELVGGALIALGLLTRAATLSLVFTFIVIVFVVKWGDGFKALELGATFLVMYVILALMGPGRWSLDHKIFVRSS